MTLKTLEERFIAASKQIYNRFQPSRDQLISIKPDSNGTFGSRSRVKNDSRILPTISFARDSRRITNFLRSPNGRLYIGKQLFLQTGNTFDGTKLYNPLSNIQIPGFHFKRNFGNTTYRGGLQSATVDTTFTLGKAPPTPKSNTSIFITSKPPAEEIRRPEYKIYSNGKVYSPFLSVKPTLDLRSSNKGTVINGDRDDWLSYVFAYGITRKYATDKISDATGNLVNASVDQTLFTTEATKTKFAKLTAISSGNFPQDFYFNTRGNAGKLNQDSLVYEESAPRLSNTNGNPVNNNRLNETSTDRKRAYDPLNSVGTGNFGVEINKTKTVNYNKLTPTQATKDSTNPDIINFAFQVNKPDEPIVQFRAFLSSLKQTTKPEFSEQKYIGRTERFVSYGGVKRTASLAFNIVAFSQQELDAVWTKINYLTGLAFPLGVSTSGFMIPPLFKISIGRIYDAQPCYIDNLDFDLIDDKITFDIDNEVPQYVNCNMNIVLLEKRSRFYNSPFYEITQNLVDAR